MATPSERPTPVQASRPSSVAAADDVIFVDAPAEAEAPANHQGEIAMVLGPLLHRPGGLRDGSVYILGLGKLRGFFGPRWPRYTGRVYEVMEQIITEEVAPKDVFARVSGETYLIAFSQESEAAAGQKVATIARRVKQKLFGQSSDLEVEIHALGGRAAAVPDAAPAADMRRDFMFIPIWDAYHKILSTYTCLPVGTMRSGRMRFGHQLMESGATDIESAEFDRSTFNFIAEIADDLHRNNFAVLVMFGMNYASLGSAKSRELLLSAFRALPKHLSSFITLAISNAPEGVARSTLAERVALVRPYFREVTYQIRTLELDLQHYAYMGLHGLSYRFWERDKALDPEQIAAIVRQARSARLQFGVSGVPDLKMAQMLADAGVTYLSGPFLGAALDMPANMRRCTLQDLGRSPQR